VCGINGIYAYHYASNPIDAAELRRTRDHMSARGPDGAGQWISEERHVGFGHRRLSIIDLSDAGAQPMTNAAGSLVVTFNGEIYNYRELRRQLEVKGRRFRSQSDTEVLLQLYAEYGEAMVGQLRGMFAFAIWDAQRCIMFLARDPYGIKPLYYADDGWTFRFASQVKALLAGGAVSRDPEPAGQVGFYLWGSVPEPFTTYRHICALPAGCVMTVDSVGAREPRRYQSIAQIYRDTESRSHCASATRQAVVRQALLDSVRHHLVADVPVGAFLSAGIDSGALVGLMRDAGQDDIQTVTLAFEEFRGRPDDEAPLAEEVARLYGTRHTTRVVTQSEFASDLPRILDAMDQPSIDGINAWFVSKAAHELGLKVAVSGLGGDELFGGYPSFRDVPNWVRWLAAPARVPLLGRTIRLIAGKFPGFASRNPKAVGMVEFGGSYEGAYMLRRGLFMPWELNQVLDCETASVGLRRLSPLRTVARELTAAPRSAFARVATLEASLYMRNQLLRDADWASMAHSLEVRVPLVDIELLRSVAATMPSIGSANPKLVLAHSPTKALPAAITSRAKTGFTTPIATWLRASDNGEQTIDEGHAISPGGHWSRQWAEQLATA
jgi:asparagine synthase (glutamine-hydrolysing)